MNKNLVVGLVAHVDAGKTTLGEAMLYRSGQLRRPGRVDHGDTFLDTDVQERERGITIFSKQARLEWKDLRLTLMDTPGHVDFSSETERVLRVLDAAVLVISGPDGVQSHTLTLWRLLRSYGVPTLLFINKMDQAGTDRAQLMRELKHRLSDACVDLRAPGAAEEIAMCGEEAMDAFLETGEVPKEETARLTAGRKLFPCLFGSALKDRGIDALMDALAECVPAPSYPEAFGARVYKISRDPQGARLTWMKITGGRLRVRDLVRGDGWEDKVSQIRLYSGAKYRAAEEAAAGEVCCVTGLGRTSAGAGLGAEERAEAPLLTPVFASRVLPPMGGDPQPVLEKLRLLEEEDPQLHVLWNAEKREIQVQLMGEVQLEILRRQFRDRFGLEIGFSEGSVLYRETIAAPVEGVGHYEPLRHYAEVHLLMEPGEPGSGLRFASACSVDDLELNWQRLILTHLMEKQHPGVLTGSPITDMKITLIAGRAHLKHTEGGDFRQATYRAVRQGLMQAQSILLEPWYRVTLLLPRDCVGRAMTDLSQMGGRFDAPEDDGEAVRLTGSVPVAAMKGYARELIAYTQGRGRLGCALQGYAPCGDQERVVRSFAYDPERDVANPADSVFCSHGAGVLVPWAEAPARMHIQTGVLRSRPAGAAAPQTASGNRKSAEEEDEVLKAIFERTYGPIRPRTAPAASRAPSVNSRPLEIAFPTEELLVVDGYNIIFAWPELKALAAESLESARTALVDILSNYHGFHPCRLVLVFDAYRVRGHVGKEEDVGGIRVVYTREGETADNFIEKTIRQQGRAKDVRVRVATSDGLEQVLVLGGGALRISASEFRAEVEAARVEIAAFLERNALSREKGAGVEQAMKAALEKKRADEQKKENSLRGQ